MLLMQYSDCGGSGVGANGNDGTYGVLPCGVGLGVNVTMA